MIAKIKYLIMRLVCLFSLPDSDALTQSYNYNINKWSLFSIFTRLGFMKKS